MTLLESVIFALLPALSAVVVWIVFAVRLKRRFALAPGILLLAGTWWSGSQWSHLKDEYSWYFKKRDVSCLLFQLVVERDTSLEQKIKTALSENPDLSDDTYARVIEWGRESMNKSNAAPPIVPSKTSP